MKRILALLPLTAFVGCASLSSYQEARTLEKGQSKIFIGATGYQDDLKTVDVKDLLKDSATEDGTSMFMLELGGRVGIMEGLDVGLRTSIPGGASIDAKYQFVGRDSLSSFQMSSGLRGGYASVQVNEQDIAVIDLIAPVYATYAPTDWMSVTLAPQFCYRISDNEYWFPSGAIVGGNVDLRLGSSIGLIGEFGYHRHLTEDYTMMNYGAALFAPFDASDLLSGIF